MSVSVEPPQPADNSSGRYLWLSIGIAVVLMVLIVPFAMHGKGGAPKASDAEREARIAPVARMTLARAPAAAASGARDAASLYAATCAACHEAGIAGAPRKGDRAAWKPRLTAGVDALVRSAAAGKGAMPARGGRADLTDAELKAMIELMTR